MPEASDVEFLGTNPATSTKGKGPGGSTNAKSCQPKMSSMYKKGEHMPDFSRKAQPKVTKSYAPVKPKNVGGRPRKAKGVSRWTSFYASTISFLGLLCVINLPQHAGENMYTEVYTALKFRPHAQKYGPGGLPTPQDKEEEEKNKKTEQDKKKTRRGLKGGTPNPKKKPKQPWSPEAKHLARNH